MTPQNRAFHLFPLGRQETATGVRHACRYERHDDGSCVDRGELWYEFQEWPKGLEPGGGDPFILAFFAFAMEEGRALHLHGRVSRSLMTNLQEFHDYWVRVDPGYYFPIDFDADTLVDDANETPQPGAVTLFSGGVDGSFTAWRHSRKMAGAGTQELRLGILNDGFERVSVERHDDFLKVIPAIQALADDIGLPLVVVRSNYRLIRKPEFVPRPFFLYATYLASLLHHFKGVAGTGLIASSPYYGAPLLPRNESNPMTDPLLSSTTMRLIHDGSCCRRINKQAALSAWPLFGRKLRVCWYPLPDGANCGRCEKCLRCMISGLVTAGEIPAGFPQSHDALRQALLEIKIKPKTRYMWQEIRDYPTPHPQGRPWLPLVELKCRKRWKERRREIRAIVAGMLRSCGLDMFRWGKETPE